MAGAASLSRARLRAAGLASAHAARKGQDRQSRRLANRPVQARAARPKENRMTIDDLVITNWQAPGDKWWGEAKASPDEQRIKTAVQLPLSWNEYQELIKRDSRVRVFEKNGDA